MRRSAQRANLAGRAYDPAVFAALPIRRGFNPGLALHLGKILECAAIAASPGSGSDCMLGLLRHDHCRRSTFVQINRPFPCPGDWSAAEPGLRGANQVQVIYVVRA